ncbi:MAG TPA: hypothetical protein VG734_00485 [Lacunisphaera sp.]|nr:hypothetical protein [Lacunisphaera sp.]
MSTLAQIKANAQYVQQQFGPKSGLDNFGYNAPSIAYLDGFLTRQNQLVACNPQSIAKFTSLIGAFVGEAIIATYGGEWQEGDGAVRLRLAYGDHVHFLNPFQKVNNRILAGQEHNLESYFSMIREILENPEVPEEPAPPTPPVAKKPWWKVF